MTFLFSKSPDHLWGPPGLQFSVYPGSVPGIRRPGRQVNHLLPSSAVVENKWSNSSTPPPTKSFHGVDSVLFTLSCFAVLGGWVGGKIVSLTLLLFYRYKYHSLHRWLGVTARMGRRKDWLRWLRLQPEERCGLRVLVYCPWHNKLLNGLPWHSAKHFSSFSYVISLNAWQLTRWKKWNWCLINNHSRLLPWLSQYTTTVNSSQDCS